MADQLYQLPLTIKLYSPVLIARTVGDENMVGSEDYIPGSVLLGAFAGMYTKKYGNVYESPDSFADFSDLFLSDSVRFLNGYPQLEWKEDAKTEKKRTLPIPLSVQYGKQKDAPAMEKLFKCDKKGQCEGKKWKLITFDDLLEESDEKNAAPISKYKSGYCSLLQNETTLHFQKVTVAKQYQLHHERTDQRVGRSADAEIFNYESIMPNQKFEALILGPQSKLQQLKSLLQENANSMRLGRSKHTQYGSSNVTAGDIREFSDEAETISKSDFLAANQFILTCTSDLVLPPDLEQISLKALATLIIQTMGIDNKDLECINAFFKTDMVEKYNAAWKARTPAQPCFVKGSCFVFELKNGSLDVLKPKLADIQREGVGIRRNEGYGRVLINWQGFPIEKKDIDQSLSLPDFTPETTLPLFQGLIKNWLIDQVQVAAADNVNKAAGTKKMTITLTQINKLKRIAVDAKTFAVFEERLGQLNENSKERLRNLHFGNQRFYDFLKNDPIQIRGLVENKASNNDEFKKLLDFADFNHYQHDPELHQALFIKYYDTLFTLLDKSLKKKSHNQGEQN